MNYPSDLASLLHPGMSLATAIAIAGELRCLIEPGHRGGEVRFSHPLARRRVCIHGESHDAPGHLVGWLRRIALDLACLAGAFEEVG